MNLGFEKFFCQQKLHILPYHKTHQCNLLLQSHNDEKTTNVTNYRNVNRNFVVLISLTANLGKNLCGQFSIINYNTRVTLTDFFNFFNFRGLMYNFRAFTMIATGGDWYQFR